MGGLDALSQPIIKRVKKEMQTICFIII